MIEQIDAIVEGEFQRLRRLLGAIFGVLLLIFVVATTLVHYAVAEAAPDQLPRALAIGILVLAAAFLFVIGATERLRSRLKRRLSDVARREIQQAAVATARAQSLQALASTLSATLSFERVVEQALDVSALALAELGIPDEAQVGAVLLFEGNVLYPVARRHMLEEESDITIAGKLGALGTALSQAELTVTNLPDEDPELADFPSFRDCLTVVCIPLRAGYQIFGAMVLGTVAAISFEEEHFDLFAAVADQAVVALQNAQLYQRLEAEKQRLIEADQEARKELARDLHDGPTQSIAAIAMRINHVRSVLARQPEGVPDQVMTELERAETLAKKTSREVRGMLFTLRPLSLETQGLGAAVESVIKQVGSDAGIETSLTGGEVGRLLDRRAQTVAFFIIEEAVNNARKHAAASQITVRFWQEQDLFVASVRDDGRGFDPEEVERGYSERGSMGQVNMRERAERVDGSVRVESAPGQGTTLTLVIPLDGHNDNGERQAEV